MMLEQTLNEFGRRMGLPGLTLGAGGLAALDVQHMGRLHLERYDRGTETELLIYLARAVPAHDRDIAGRILELTHYRHPRSFALSAGIHNDQALVLIRLPERQVTVSNVEKAVLLLAESMDRIIRRD